MLTRHAAAVGRARIGMARVGLGRLAGAGAGHARLRRIRLRHGRLSEIVADQLALLVQELVEVLVHVLLADRFRGQVQILELLELARLRLLRCLRTVVPRPSRPPLLRPGGRRPTDRASGLAGRQQRLERTADLLILRSRILRHQVIPVRGVVRGRPP